jgi:hypothetical protein
MNKYSSANSGSMCNSGGVYHGQVAFVIRMFSVLRQKHPFQESDIHLPTKPVYSF